MRLGVLGRAAENELELVLEEGDLEWKCQSMGDDQSREERTEGKLLGATLTVQ